MKLFRVKLIAQFILCAIEVRLGEHFTPSLHVQTFSTAVGCSLYSYSNLLWGCLCLHSFRFSVHLQLASIEMWLRKQHRLGHRIDILPEYGKLAEMIMSKRHTFYFLCSISMYIWPHSPRKEMH